MEIIASAIFGRSSFTFRLSRMISFTYQYAHCPSNRIYKRALESKYLAGDVEAVISFNERLLQCSEYPEEFPSGIRVEYVAFSKELVVEKELPEVKIIPVMNRFRYIKAED